MRNKALSILEQLVKADIITPGYAPFTAQIRWVVKAQPDDHSRIPGQKAINNDKGNDLRMAIDFSHMKSKVAKQQFPLVPVRKILQLLRGSRVISSLDLRKAFWQVEICDESKMIWAFEGESVIIILHCFVSVSVVGLGFSHNRCFGAYLFIYLLLYIIL